MSGHTWSQPVCGKGDRIYAEKHRGGAACGTVYQVETHYNHRREHYHTYWVRFDGLDRGQWLGEKAILSVEEPRP